MFISASIGVAVNTSLEDSPLDLLRFADVAMYVAKKEGTGLFRIFDPSMNTEAWERLELEYDLRLATEREEFVVFYQPIVELATGRISGMEALVRWEHPQRGRIPPSQFVPLAEETGLILAIGRQVLRQACLDTRSWHARYPDQEPLIISVNLSARQFQQPDLVESIAAVLAETGLPARCLKLEITESVVMGDAEATIVKLLQMKTLGVLLAIDDFGTGYSSLTYLKRFPVDTLKIDRAFVSGIVDDAEDAAIVQTVITLAHTFGLSVTAEGVETGEVGDLLRDLGCELGQGYFYSRPVPAAAAGALLGRPHDPPALEHIEPTMAATQTTHLALPERSAWPFRNY
jgi:EAL domain-containing protein (putative c-di-GMP-specific phosphodiesterase class I)